MSNIDGFKEALETLQFLDEESRARILADIAEKDPRLAARLKEGLFDFSDLQFLLATDFKVIWWEVPRITWQLALRKAPSGVLKMLERHMSKRAFQEFSELLSNQGPQPAAQVLRAQNEICETIRHFARLGKMAIPSAHRNNPMV